MWNSEIRIIAAASLVASIPTLLNVWYEDKSYSIMVIGAVSTILAMSLYGYITWQ